MIDQPFKILRPFVDHLHVTIFKKEDDSTSDEAVAQQCRLEDIASLWQEHGNRTIVVSGPTHRTEHADGMMTRTSNLLLSIRWADCQNFVAYEPEQHICGLLHVGWRGLIAGVVPSFFQTLEDAFGVQPQEVLVGAGPSLCQHCTEFTDPRKELPTVDQCFIDGRCVDLRGLAEAQLMGLGVLPEHFERHPDCTRCNPERYWTYRGGHQAEVQEGHTNVLCCAMVGEK